MTQVVPACTRLTILRRITTGTLTRMRGMHTPLLLKQLAATALALLLSASAWAAYDPLPSWRDGATRQRLITFISNASTAGHPDFVAPEDRVAVLDDDGTLWPEKPRPQGVFALERLRSLAPGHPEWRRQLPYAAALDLGTKFMQEASSSDVLEILATAHAGRSQDAFRNDVRSFFATARHPRFNRLYTDLTYQPMVELVTYLRRNSFRVFISSPGSIELVRELAWPLYGIPPDDVIGSTVVTVSAEENGRAIQRRLATVHSLNDGATKPQAIELHIGRRPILAVGNAGGWGDIDMLRYSEQPGRQTLQVLIRHDDFDREYAYDEPDGMSVKVANQKGWLVVSMRNDWLQVFGDR